MRETAREAGAPIVTGDTKVMGTGEVDGIVLNTTGVALDRPRRHATPACAPGDRVIVTGTIGDHGMAIMSVRHDLRLEGDLRSDVAPLNGLVRAALARRRRGRRRDEGPDPRRRRRRAPRDGGEGEGRASSSTSRRVPVRDEVRAAGEMIGIDPLLVANEGKAVHRRARRRRREACSPRSARTRSAANAADRRAPPSPSGPAP